MKITSFIGEIFVIFSVLALFIFILRTQNRKIDNAHKRMYALEHKFNEHYTKAETRQLIIDLMEPLNDQLKHIESTSSEIKADLKNLIHRK